MYFAAAGAGVAGGWLSEHGLESYGFLACAILMGSVAALALFAISERRATRTTSRQERNLLAFLRDREAPPLLAVTTFLCLWSFNPFCNTVLYVHMTTTLGFSEQFYGLTLTLMSLGGVVGSVAYWFYCRKFEILQLTRVSIWLGIAATLAYALLGGPASASVISIFVGATYITAVLIQLDLVARLCPPVGPARCSRP
ncbi:MAG: MFS transporter [Planctomycetes bacterium]|nr:MFS transporter [Planctomycetota bacterium]